MQLGPIRATGLAWSPIRSVPLPGQVSYQELTPLSIDRMEFTSPGCERKVRVPSSMRLKLLSATALSLSLCSLGTPLAGQLARWSERSATVQASQSASAHQLPNALTEVPQRFTKDAVHRHYLSEDEESLSTQGKALYEGIKERYLGGAEKIELGSPTAYFTGGLPGSGKGQILEKMHRLGGFVVVDPDLLKRDVMVDLVEKNPHLRESMQQEKDWGTVVHWTSSLLAKELMQDALRAGLDVVYDSSMSTPDRQRYKDFVDQARAQGYRVQAMICQVNLEKSIERAEKRANKPVHIESSVGTLELPGRRVTADYVRECSERLQENLLLFQAARFFDHVSTFDNSQDGQPMRLISSRSLR